MVTNESHAEKTEKLAQRNSRGGIQAGCLGDHRLFVLLED